MKFLQIERGGEMFYRRRRALSAIELRLARLCQRPKPMRLSQP